jgi:hypothetical protein
MDQLSKEHNCSGIPNEKVSVIPVLEQAKFGQDIQWMLYITKLASEEDLEENHYLENRGDLMWSTTIAIKYCPYCGMELQKENPAEKTESMYSECRDFTGCYSRSL